ncbi:MAG: DUF5989 family protein [Nanoarchaeota archaeon]
MRRRRLKRTLASELFVFLMQNKRWWLLPSVILLLIIGVLIIFAQTSAVTPFFYVLF